MDSEGIKERFMTNMWLLFSEGLATEALYNICTRPTMGLLGRPSLICSCRMLKKILTIIPSE